MPAERIGLHSDVLPLDIQALRRVCAANGLKKHSSERASLSLVNGMSNACIWASEAQNMPWRVRKTCSKALKRQWKPRHRHIILHNWFLNIEILTFVFVVCNVFYEIRLWWSLFFNSSPLIASEMSSLFDWKETTIFSDAKLYLSATLGSDAITGSSSICSYFMLITIISLRLCKSTNYFHNRQMFWCLFSSEHRNFLILGFLLFV